MFDPLMKRIPSELFAFDNRRVLIIESRRNEDHL